MPVIRERVFNSKPSHYKKRNVIHHARLIGRASRICFPSVVPVIFRRVNQKTTPLQLDSKAVNFKAIWPARRRIGALQQDERCRHKRGLIAGKFAEGRFGTIMPCVTAIPQRKQATVSAKARFKADARRGALQRRPRPTRSAC